MLQPFYKYTPDFKGIELAIKERKFDLATRQILVEVLQQQYADLPVSAAVMQNIKSLADEHTFTVCTAHQPNLLGGPLYFFYKIIHAIRLADELNERFPGKRFVPVFYLGSEDNDLDELGNFFFYGKKYTWNTQQAGAVGRMNTEDLQPLLAELFQALGPQGAHKDSLQELITEAFKAGRNIADATRRVVHALLADRGIVVLNPDDAALKGQFKEVMKDDLMRHTALGLVQATSETLNTNFSAQAFPREINLFYLVDHLRNRIEKDAHGYTVVGTDIRFTEAEILEELDQHPERFSPNVILRGLYQETILPNVAFIGGGAEVAYWLQLKSVFEHYGVSYPVILLRQSFVWINKATQAVIEKTGLGLEQIFEPVEEIVKQAAMQGNRQLELSEEFEAFESLFARLREKALAISNRLEYSTEAVYTKIKKQLDVLQHKMVREEKRKYELLRRRVYSIKEQIYPAGSFQERKLSFMEFYLLRGKEYFDLIYRATLPLGNQFGVIMSAD